METRPIVSDQPRAGEVEVEKVVQAISVPCGRCRGTGKERHQLDRDPAAGYGEHRCPNCWGDGRTVMHATPSEVARRAIEALRV